MDKYAKGIVTGIFLAIIALLSLNATTNNNDAKIGKYQIACTDDNVYMIDTETGSLYELQTVHLNYISKRTRYWGIRSVKEHFKIPSGAWVNGERIR